MAATWLEHAQDVGLIGPASLRFHVEHAVGFHRDAIRGDSPNQDSPGWDNPAWDDIVALDLGSGGGLPGLVLALEHPSSRWVLLDARLRSVSHLREAVASVGVDDRVEVIQGRAEKCGRDPELRESFDIVTARGFAAPAVTAECAAAFLRVGGRLIVSEPPESDDRWPADGLSVVGLRSEARWQTSVGHYRSFTKTEPLSDRFPRRVGIPKKRPIF